MSPAVLQAENVCRVFGARYVLRDLNFSVQSGEAVSVTGDNGAGKTTLLRIATTLLTPSSGRVTLFDSDAEDTLPEIRRRIGALFADTHFYVDLSVCENLRLYANLHHIDHRDAVISTWLTRFGMEAHLDSPVRTLSRGERQRAGLIRSLLHRPTFVIWDEPTTGLDTRGREIVNDVARELKGATTFLVATHDPAALAGWTDRALRLERGRLQ
ncbi:MAG: ABC transporter ATP-binding protein [Pseudomonadota bacterium]